MVKNKVLKIMSTNETYFCNITNKVLQFVAQHNVENGQVLVFSPHTTCSVFTQEISHDEHDSGIEYMMQDTLNMLCKIAPDTMQDGKQIYEHPGPEHVAAALGYGETVPWLLNTDAHLRSVLLGRSVSVPIVNGNLVLGRFSSIYFADFDTTRAREREVYMQITF